MVLLYILRKVCIAECLKITKNVAFNIASEASYVYILRGKINFWQFSPIFVLLKVTCLVTLFDRKLQIFKNSSKLTIFAIFNERLTTQNVNIARFARNVE